jgi:hypothetical protein
MWLVFWSLCVGGAVHILKSVRVRMLLRVCVGSGGRSVVGRATVFGYAQS